MCKKFKAYNVERNNIFKRIFMSVLAEEPQPQAGAEPQPQAGNEPPKPSEPQSSTINYEDLISKARQQEKDKLYPKITALEKEKADLIEKNNKALLKIGTLETEIETLNNTIRELRENSGASDNEKKLQKEVDKLTKELENTKANIVSREDIEKEVKAEYEIKLYKETKLNELKGQLIPELVVGSTKEEIDASIETSKNRYAELFASAQPQPQAQPQQVFTGIVNPTAKGLTAKTLNLNDIANLDPRSPEYAQMRAQMGLR